MWRLKNVGVFVYERRRKAFYVRVYLGDVLAVDADAAPLRVVEAEQQTQDGALPRPRRTHLKTHTQAKSEDLMGVLIVNNYMMMMIKRIKTNKERISFKITD